MDGHFIQFLLVKIQPNPLMTPTWVETLWMTGFDHVGVRSKRKERKHYDEHQDGWWI